MQTEIEAKFLDINPDAFRTRLKDLGAKLIAPERLMRRRNYDYPERSRMLGWVRLRDEGDKFTLTYKQLNDRTLHGTKEINLVVSDFEAADHFLKALGLTLTSYQETRRESWQYGPVAIEIDTWPWIPSFIELEGDSEASLKDAATKLSLDWGQALHGSVEIAYQHYYQVTDDEIDTLPEITFSPVPNWLEARRHQKAGQGKTH